MDDATRTRGGSGAELTAATWRDSLPEHALSARAAQVLHAGTTSSHDVRMGWEQLAAVDPLWFAGRARDAVDEVGGDSDLAGVFLEMVRHIAFGQVRPNDEQAAEARTAYAELVCQFEPRETLRFELENLPDDPTVYALCNLVIQLLARVEALENTPVRA